MGASEKYAATFHPEPWHHCESCGCEWRSVISAAMCCDALSNDLHRD
jgi:hypothetical protein